MSGTPEQFISGYLSDREGMALAGDVIRAAAANGHAPSTTRRAASAIVDKHRDGNTFTWTLRGATTEAPADMAEALGEPYAVAWSRHWADPLGTLHRRILARPNLEPWHDSCRGQHSVLTHSEAALLLDLDDDGEIDRPAAQERKRRVLPY